MKKVKEILPKAKRIRSYEKQERCQCCGKWVGEYELVLLPEETWQHLDSENEFSICEKCSEDEKKDLKYWLTWVKQKRDK